MQHKQGTVVVWTTGGRGGSTTKRGVVKGYIPKNAHLSEILPEIGKSVKDFGAKNVSECSTFDRYIVEVEGVGLFFPRTSFCKEAGGVEETTKAAPVNERYEAMVRELQTNPQCESNGNLFIMFEGDKYKLHGFDQRTQTHLFHKVDTDPEPVPIPEIKLRDEFQPPNNREADLLLQMLDGRKPGRNDLSENTAAGLVRKRLAVWHHIGQAPFKRECLKLTEEGDRVAREAKSKRPLAAARG